MKKAIIISIVIFISVSVKSQYETWSNPIALTDSSSYNSNPELATLPEYSYGNLFMFYEKRQQPQGISQIWWKNISAPNSEEQILIGGLPDVDYLNPKILNNDILVYECNISGNYDLYGIKIDEFGTVGNSFQLTDTEYDERSFYGENYYLPYCCWESNGNIIIADIDYSSDSLQFLNLITIDTGNCNSPSCLYKFITWQKIENNESHIYYSEKEYSSSDWSEPDTIIHTNDNTNLSVSRAVMDGGDHVCWQSSNNVYYKIKYPGAEIYSPDFSDIENYYEPTVYTLVILSKYDPDLHSFVGETESIRNIYISDGMYSNNVIQLTNDTLIEKKPRFLTGRYFTGAYEIYNMWQTEINGYDVLYTSFAIFSIGGINDNTMIELNIAPNPVSNNQNIIISSPENISIYSAQIYSVSGELILKTDFNSKSQQHEIDLKNALPGVYFIKIQTSQGESVKKLIIK